ncbi:hypothetical protein RCL1_007397 [Eukaryota sp. TZLM3-RCL]
MERRLPILHPHARKNQFYLTAKTVVPAVVKRAVKLFDSSVSCISLNATGNATFKAVHAANCIRHTYHLPLTISIETFSVDALREHSVSGSVPKIESKARCGIMILLKKS